ncbi:MAG: hypothetical protein EOO65_04300, partial [Methanosarcinales archaeon]
MPRCRDADASRPRRGSVASEVKDAVMEAGGAPRASMTTFRTGNTAAGVRASRSRRGGGGRGAREVDGGSESEEGGDTGAASDLELSALIDQALQGSGVAPLNPAEYQKMLSRFREWFQSSASSMDPAVRLDFIRRALTAQDASPLDDALRASMEAAGKAFLKRHKQPPPPPSAVPDVEEDALKAAASPRGTGAANTHITAAAPKEAGRPSRRDALNKRHEGLLKTMQEQSKSRIAMRGGSHARRASISDAAALQALQGMATGARGKGHDGRGRAVGAGVGGRHGGRRASVTLGAPLDSSSLKGSGSDDGSASPGQRSNLIQSLRAAGEQFQRVLGPSSVPLAATNNNFYTADSTYGRGSSLGRGYTVYTGSGHTITVTGLQPNTYYYITNAEYNTDSTSIMYNTRGSSIIMPTRNTKILANNPLPVKLTSFAGQVDGHNLATLCWTTASEYNTAYFALERSAEGISFTEVGRVAAAGASNQSLAYQWNDIQQLTHLTYYRLRQADNDGTVVYSSVVALSPN